MVQLINKLYNMSTTISNIAKKRLVGELKLLKKKPLELVDTFPDESDPLVWFFLLKGPTETDYDGGYYLGKILHSPEYPLKPPDFMMLTPSGRFEIEKKICLTNSGYHSDEWKATWNMQTILLGFLSIMADDSTHGISHIKKSKEERAIFARESVNFNVKRHFAIWTKFERFVNPDGTIKT